MPDLVGQDAEQVRRRLESFGFRVGSARFEAYEGVAPNTVLKQFPPAGFPIDDGYAAPGAPSGPPASPVAASSPSTAAIRQTQVE